jgi:hypothetical protein
MIVVDVEVLEFWITRELYETDIEDEVEVMREKCIYGLAMEEGK